MDCSKTNKHTHTFHQRKSQTATEVNTSQSLQSVTINIFVYDRTMAGSSALVALLRMRIQRRFYTLGRKRCQVSSSTSNDLQGLPKNSSEGGSKFPEQYGPSDWTKANSLLVVKPKQKEVGNNCGSIQQDTLCAPAHFFSLEEEDKRSYHCYSRSFLDLYKLITANSFGSFVP